MLSPTAICAVDLSTDLESTASCSHAHRNRCLRQSGPCMSGERGLGFDHMRSLYTVGELDALLLKLNILHDLTKL